MTKEPFRFTDNIRVKIGREHKDGTYSCQEYLRIAFYEGEGRDDRAGCEREVILSRYTVPGRCDTYSFTMLLPDMGPAHVAFFSDHSTLAEALPLVQADLNKPQVVELLSAAVSNKVHGRYSVVLVEDILASIAPKSKAYRACKKAIDKMMVEVTKQIEANKVKRLEEASALVAANPVKS